MINLLARAYKNLLDHPRTAVTNVSAIASAQTKWLASTKNVAIRASMHAASMLFAMLLVTRRCARALLVTLVIHLRSVLLNNVRGLKNNLNIQIFKKIYFRLYSIFIINSQTFCMKGIQN